MNKNILKNRKAILSAALIVAATATAFAQDVYKRQVLWRGTHSMLASWLPTSFLMCFSSSASSLHAMTLKCARTEVSP